MTVLDQEAEQAARREGIGIGRLLSDVDDAAVAGRSPMGRPVMRWMKRVALLLLLAGLLYLALRSVPVDEIRTALGRLQVWQLGAFLLIDLTIYALITARWWLVVRAQNGGLAFLPFLAVRLSAFALSYFTLGPQIGGEPLQMLYLQRQHGVSYTRAAASVVLDKLLELLANFVLLTLALLALLHSGLLAGMGALSYLALISGALFSMWPLIHILLLFRGVYPLSVAVHRAAPRLSRTRALRFLCASERLAGRFCLRNPRAMLASTTVSLLSAAGTVSEYWLITSFLHVRLPFWQMLTAWAAGWLSFLMPLPGGLGALEASQVYALGFFGISAASAISLTLVLRARDLLVGGVGLLLTGWATRRGGDEIRTGK